MTSTPGTAEAGRPLSRTRRAWLVAAIVFSLVGLVGSTVAFAAISGSAGPRSGSGRAFTQAGCTVPSLPGSVVTFTALDMGMGTGMGGGMMGGTNSDTVGPMRLRPGATTVPAGQVSLVLRNAGTRPHELVVLPLAPGQVAGQRTVGSDDRVSEAGSLGEVRQVCPADAGVDGTVPGGIATVTLTLAPGSYEVVCNLPGHYRAGMYATLTVA